ncbi:MAG: hypothetical protein RLZZ458_2011 [Planctomycetota bacterium]
MLSNRWIRSWALAVVAVIMLVGVWFWRGGSWAGDGGDGDGSASAERRRGGSEIWLGTAGCVECHREQHSSWQGTAHSQAMSRVAVEWEPADGEYVHEASGRVYKSQRRDVELWHVESGAAGEGEVAAKLEYLVGSGRHSRTYVAEFEGFLVESPLTWYSSTGSWSMSPGYDHAEHQGFERPVDAGCLVCHCGQIELAEESYHRLKIGELAIGCERCHGPGRGHAEYQRAQTSGTSVERTGGDFPEDSIVHPKKLGRDHQDAICAQCHLRGDATVFRSGRGVNDFRPGELLTSVRVDWFLRSGAGGMKVVGHSDQMTASECWKVSGTLTCITCHAGHGTAGASPAERLAEYRRVCLSCHVESACGEAADRRAQTEPRDNCISCHMPQVSTDIPHIAFTHHRIGIHSDEPAVAADVATAELVPFGSTEGVSELELRRLHALACAEYAVRAESAELRERFRRQAFSELRVASVKLPEDGEVWSALSRLYWEGGELSLAEAAAGRALGAVRLSIGSRVNALFVRGDARLQGGRIGGAVTDLEDLVRLRRNSEDWLLLGLAYTQRGDKEAGAAAVEVAGEISPWRREVKEALMRMRGSGVAEGRN